MIKKITVKIVDDYVQHSVHYSMLKPAVISHRVSTKTAPCQKCYYSPIGLGLFQYCVELVKADTRDSEMAASERQEERSGKVAQEDRTFQWIYTF